MMSMDDLVTIGVEMSRMVGSEVDKSSKLLIYASNVAKTIKLNIQCNEAPRRDDPII